MHFWDLIVALYLVSGRSDLSSTAQPLTTCSSGFFKCKSGPCIPSSQRCDSYNDCLDTSDELNCTECGSDGFLCKDISGRCIRKSKQCDGNADCPGQSDEVGCQSSFSAATQPPCAINQFRCRDSSLCIDASLVCDTIPNCPDESDENPRDCTLIDPAGNPVLDESNIAANLQQCGPDQAKCRKGPPYCIPRNYVCDGDPDCMDASDEENCEQKICEPNEFQCRSFGGCRLKVWKCDGQDDCRDGYDEEGCVTPRAGQGCGETHIPCKYNTSVCIQRSFHCDGNFECFDRSDEEGCGIPTITKLAPYMYMAVVGETVILTCEATGIPAPLISWRWNWGVLPDNPPRITQTDSYYKGVLTIRNVKLTDAGAYTCEAINSKGNVMGKNDTNLIVKPPQGLCQSPYFNTDARDETQCISCFCFNVTNRCFSSNKYRFKLFSGDQTQVVQWLQPGKLPAPEASIDYLAPSRQFSVTGWPDQLKHDFNYYFVLPSYFIGSQLTAYGGNLKFKIWYDVDGNQPSSPFNYRSGIDVIMKGNNQLVYYRSIDTETPFAGVDKEITVPIHESVWHTRPPPRQAGDTPSAIPSLASRGELLRVLANVEYILIRASFDDRQKEVRLGVVSMDSAQDLAPLQGTPIRAAQVEKCACPAGYIGASCEDCDRGYYRVADGNWLGRCIPCQCNGHSETCDKNTGRCQNCRDNTEGDHCDRCVPGYYGNPINGGECKPCPCPGIRPPAQRTSQCRLDTDGGVTCDNCPTGYTGRQCNTCAQGYTGDPLDPIRGCYKQTPSINCDERGTESQTHSKCNCKKYVEGVLCDRCKPGAFYLDKANPNGCFNCFCFGHSNDCRASPLYRDITQQEFQTEADKDGVSLTNLANTRVATNKIILDSVNQALIAQGADFDADTLYWTLPEKFLGDKVRSYGGKLRFVATFTDQGGEPNDDPVVVIKGNNRELKHYSSNIAMSGDNTDYEVQMNEMYWVTLADSRPVSREDFLATLAKVDGIYVKASYATNLQSTSLKNVRLDTAIEFPDNPDKNLGTAFQVEYCRCPAQYKDVSCQQCASGYYRSNQPSIYLPSCVPCQCNGHSLVCEPETGVCRNCRDNTEGDNCERCKPGYIRNPATGACQPAGQLCGHCNTAGIDPDRTPSCDPVTQTCYCKEKVTGLTCGTCKDGDHFGPLSEVKEGCLPCWCNRATTSCTASNYRWNKIYLDIRAADNVWIVNYNGDLLASRETGLASANQLVHFDDFDDLRDQDFTYFSLQAPFNGSKVNSYGGRLRFTLRFSPDPSYPKQPYDRYFDIVLLTKDGKRAQALAFDSNQPVADTDTQYDILLTEKLFGVSRSEFMNVLANVKMIMIRNNFVKEIESVELKDLSMDVAKQPLESAPNANDAFTVEKCDCPEGYAGLSCERCTSGYVMVRGECRRFECNCNNHADSCNPQTGQCYCKHNTTGMNCEKCRDGFYGDATQGRPNDCKPCNCYPLNRDCPGTGQMFMPITCQQDARGQVRCNCEEGYIGDKCERCDAGYQGDPMQGRPCNKTAVVRVTITGPPTVVAAGDTVTLNCVAELTAESYQVTWKRENNRDLPAGYTLENNRQRLVFVPTKAADGGVYICHARGQLSGRSGSGTFPLQVRGSLGATVTAQPGQVVDLRTYVRLTCDVTGADNAPVTVTWRHKGGDLPADAAIYGHVIDVFIADENSVGEFVCYASATDGRSASASINIQLRIAPQVTVTLHPPNLVLAPPTEVTLLCAVQPVGAYALEWRRDPLQALPPGYYTDQDSQRLIFTMRDNSDLGRYICTARSTSPTGPGVTGTGYIDLVARPEEPLPRVLVRIISPTGPVTIQGTTVEIECQVTSASSVYQISWTKDNSPQLPAGYEIRDNGARLLFPASSNNDQGDYSCTVTTGSGQSVSSTVELILNIRNGNAVPTVRRVDVRPGLDIEVGSSVSMTCVVVGSSNYQVTWYRENNEPLPPGYSYSSNFRVLNFAAGNATHSGRYTCQATNVYGTSESSVNLNVTRKVGPVRRFVYVAYPPNKRWVAKVGDRIRFDCRATGLMSSAGGPLTNTSDGRSYVVFWRRGYNSVNGQLPDNAEARMGQLEFTNVQLDNQGNYTCSGGDAQIRFDQDVAELIVLPDGKRSEGQIGDVSLNGPVAIREGGTLKLFCKAQGSPVPTLSLERADGRPLTGAFDPITGEYTIPSVRESDGGQYVCTAKNTAGMRTSSYKLFVIGKPAGLTASVVPSSLALEEGQEADFRCLSEDTTVSYRWESRFGRHIANGQQLLFSSVTKEDAGLYRCRVRRPDGAEAMATVELKVFASLSGRAGGGVVDRPVSVTVSISPGSLQLRTGEAAEFRCTVSDPSAAEFEFSWRASADQDLPTGWYVSGGSLIIRDFRPENKGSYTCTVSEPRGFSASESATIDVAVIVEKPKITAPEKVSIKYGATMDVTCSATGNPTPKVVWSRHPEKISDRVQIIDLNEGAGQILRFSDFTDVDRGYYLCTATSDTEVSTKYVLIESAVTGIPPSLKVLPASKQTVKMGRQGVYFQCVDNKGVPTSNVSWERIDGETFTALTVIDRNIIRFQEATKDEEGLYRCTAQNAHGTVSVDVEFIVEEPLRVSISGPTELSVQQGDNVTINCYAMPTEPEAYLHWQYPSGLLSNETTNQQVLKLNAVTRQQIGTYWCKGRRNDGESHQVAFHLTVRVPVKPTPPPVPVMTETMQATAGSKVALTCSVTAEGEVNIRWYMDDNGVERIVSDRAEVQNNVLTIKNIQSSDQGLYVCEVFNKDGVARAQFNLTVQVPVASVGLSVDGSTNPGNEVQVTNGQTVFFECQVTNAPPQSVWMWYKDGSDISTQAKGNRLTIQNVSNSDQGTYLCRLINGQQLVGEKTFRVRLMFTVRARIVSNPPQPAVGDLFEFTCVVENIPGADITWLRSDGKPLGSDLVIDGNVLRFPALKAEHSGTYVCSVKKDTIHLQANGFLQISAPPTGQTQTVAILPGQTASLDCSVPTGYDLDGVPVWKRKSGADLADKMTVTLDSSAGTKYTLTIPSFGRADIDGYYCEGRLKNGGTFASQTVQLELKGGVQTPTKLMLTVIGGTVSGSTVNAIIGSSLSLTCEAEPESPIAASWTWYKDGKAITASNGNTLKITGVSSLDAGEYKCRREIGSESNEVMFTLSTTHAIADRQMARLRTKGTIELGKPLELHCIANNTGAQFRWSRVDGRMPDDVQVSDNVLRIGALQSEHLGTYRCEVDIGISTLYLNARISLPVADSVTVYVSPKSLMVQPGEFAQFTCNAQGADIVRWEHVAGDNISGNLPDGADVRPNDNTLFITSVAKRHVGIYRCIATSAKGAAEGTVTLLMEGEPVPDSSSLQPFSHVAPVSLNATLQCRVFSALPIEVKWQRTDGKPLPEKNLISVRIDMETSMLYVHLDINGVKRNSSGLYECIVSNKLGESKEQIHLAVTDLVPEFRQSPVSFIAFPKLAYSYNSIVIDLTFKSYANEGLLLYGGDSFTSDDGSTKAVDFILFGLRNGSAEFSFDMGSGAAKLVSPKPIKLNTWITAKLIRNGTQGVLIINGVKVTGVSPCCMRGMSFNTSLFVGGMPSFDMISRSAPEYQLGFEGAISQLAVEQKSYDLGGDALQIVGVDGYSECAGRPNPCLNEGVCEPRNTAEGFWCKCTEGFFGKRCEQKGLGCREGLCGDGRCKDLPNGQGVKCSCTIGKTGTFCNDTLFVDVPSFSGSSESFVAYPAPSDNMKLTFKMVFKSRDLSDSLLMFGSHQSGDFFAVWIQNKKLQFRYNLGSGSTTLRQTGELEVGEWNTVIGGRQGKDGWLQVNSEDRVKGETPGPAQGLSLDTLIYIGGVPPDMAARSELAMTINFDGCLGELWLNGKKLELVKDVVDSTNIGQCEDKPSTCQLNDCQNRATCQSVGDSYKCICATGFTGTRCESVIDVCLLDKPCPLDKSNCTALSVGYKCECFLGFYGELCETVLPNATSSVNFNTASSFLRLPGNSINHKADCTVIDFNIRTKSSNGSILWHGQASDYMAVGLKQGRVIFTFDMGSGSAVIKSPKTVNDGEWHNVNVIREDGYGYLAVDMMSPSHGSSKGHLTGLNVNSESIYLGTVPSYASTAARSRNIMPGNFIGCINELKFGEDCEKSPGVEVKQIFSSKTMTGLNILSCDSS